MPLGSTPDCIPEHVQYCRQRMSMYQDLSRIIKNTTITVVCHHAYSRITPIFQVVTIRGTIRDSVTGVFDDDQR
jgi:hypothetical protein